MLFMTSSNSDEAFEIAEHATPISDRAEIPYVFRAKIRRETQGRPGFAKIGKTTTARDGHEFCGWPCP